MRIAFLLPTAYDLGGTAGAVATQANALVSAGHEVEVLSVHRRVPEPHFTFDHQVRLTDLVDLREQHLRAGELTPDQVRALAGKPPRLIDPGWDPQLDALADIALETALPRLEADVLVTVTPALLAIASTLLPPGTALVHQEHRSSSQRRSSRQVLLDHARRADVVAMLTEPMAAWMRRELGAGSPEVVVVPNALPATYRPRSPLTSPVIVAAGRLAAEKQYHQLITAFGSVADRLPGWRLRIFGDGPQRFAMMGTIRKLGLWDRVELPGPTPDLAAEWARASISALSSTSEGFPLVMQEAMAAGLPVVAYDCPSGPRAIVDDGVDGLLVACGSVPGMAAALLRLGQDAEERTRLGAAALASSARWAPETVRARWEEVFTDAVRRRRGAVGRATTLHLEAPHEGARARSLDPEVAPEGREGHGVAPAEARRAALEAVCAAASESAAPSGAASPWWVVPPHDTDETTVVMAMSARRGFLRALTERLGRDGTTYLSLLDPEERGWPARRGTASEMLEPLLRGRTSRLLVEPWPRVGEHASLLGRDCGVTVEFWEEGPDGELHSPGRARYATRVPRAPTLTTTRVHDLDVPTHPVMTAPTPTEATFEVDVVWTWVDGSDPAWDAAREARLAGVVDPALHSRTSSGRARFVDRGELRWSMRSVHLFAPWVRRLHLVTAGQTPDWLDVDHPRVNLVDHRDLLPPEALPTYNSHAIEAGLHRIEGLAEHFLYLNDDFFLAAPTRPERFFTGSGSTAVFASTGVVGLPGQDDLPYLHAAAHNRRLLEQAFGRVVLHTLAHAPYAHRRSRLAEIAARFAPEVEATMRAPFRSPTDVSMLSSLGQHYGLMNGTAHLADADFAYVDLTDPTVRMRLDALLERDRAGFCLGDSHDFARDPALVAELVTDTLDRVFPIPAPWER